MIVAYYALHYGSDYLGWSIKSIYDQVDKIHISHTDRPSYGHVGGMKNPDTKEKMLESAHRFGDPQNKIIWDNGYWTSEGAHRDSVVNKYSNADAVLVVDADEIWDEKVLEKALRMGAEAKSKRCLIRMLTFWKSFSWVCADEMMPVRLIYPKRTNNDVTYLEGRVFHFGYARDELSTEYKISCHGHKSEWRHDWITRFKNWPASGNKDLHPTCVDTWSCEPYDKSQLPEFMKTHPYYDLEVIR